jgi:hypothetical protein
MGKITLDKELQAKLNGLNEQIELCDESGQTVGHFVPLGQFQAMMRAWAKAEFTDQEIAQARSEIKSEKGYSTAEAIAYLNEVAARM